MDDFDVEASPRQNRLKMGASPSCTRRRRNRPDQREEILSGSPTQLQPSENLYSSTLSTASSDSESSESRRTSSRDLSIYSAQLRKYRDRRDRDSSEERDPQNRTKETENSCAKTKHSDNSSRSDATSNDKDNTTTKRHTPTAEKTKRKLRKKRCDPNGDTKPSNRTDFALDSIAEKRRGDDITIQRGDHQQEEINFLNLSTIDDEQQGRLSTPTSPTMSWISEKISVYSDKIVNYTPAVPYISLNPYRDLDSSSHGHPPINDKNKRGCCSIV